MRVIRLYAANIVATLLLAACHGGPVEMEHPCPTDADLYAPAGFEVAAAGECSTGCVLDCNTYPETCAGVNGLWCEACEDIEAFRTGPCAQCWEKGDGVVVGFTCDDGLM